MFASLKNKIREETGTEISTGRIPAQQQQRTSNIGSNRSRSRFSSTISMNSADDGGGDQSSNIVIMQLAALRGQCNELTTEIAGLNSRVQLLQDDKKRLEKANDVLLQTVKAAQSQNDLYREEQEKIQDMQQCEIEKLKNLLSFREQEAVDRLEALHQSQQQIEILTNQLERLKQVEPMIEDLQDELERLRHSSQLDKNNLTTTLAAVEEENRHFKMRLKIVEKARLETINTLDSKEKMHALLQERKLLEQHLEEAHLQLSDIKSSWSGQNLALETQVSRLSKQVAEETTEKRRVSRERDLLKEKINTLEFEQLKYKDELKQRDDKIKLLEEEIDEMNATLKGYREDFERNKIVECDKIGILEQELKHLQAQLQKAEELQADQVLRSEKGAQSLNEQLIQAQQQLIEIESKFELEREEKLTALLKNAEISQNGEILKKQLRVERKEIDELHELNEKLEETIKSKEIELSNYSEVLTELHKTMEIKDEKIKAMEKCQNELDEKNKTIKILNQRIADIKKTLQKEFRTNASSFDGNTKSLENGFTPEFSSTPTDESVNKNIVMDEVNFKYLKHVIVKFLTSREMEARHLLRVVSMLLRLSKEEEKLLHDTLNWKISWFGSKPDHGSGQLAFAIPPS